MEESIQKVKSELFGNNRIYLDIKKKIGKKGIQENIPDGYLIDLSSKEPKLYFVENELVDHDALRHIAVQIMQFSIAFEVHPRKVRDILFNELHHNEKIRNICDNYISSHGYRNLDHLLDCLIANPFSVLIVIDGEHSKLENSIIQKFNFSVDIIRLARYRNSENNYFYMFEPFLQDVVINNIGLTETSNVNVDEVDTIIIPARDNGFKEVFINERRWYEIRMESSMRQKIKYIAAYQVAPISAITHLATIKSIEPWGDNGKWVINFEDTAEEIELIPLKKDGKVKAPQAPRYAVKDKLLQAKTLEDIWGGLQLSSVALAD
ncbi:MAG: hypothetical protein LEGION0403_FIIPPAGN_02866 [Legionella sp.]|uniref:hypothetical protein n=1 Tax=Legionella sp. TaxID=459 RepID=UPI003D0D7DEF